MDFYNVITNIPLHEVSSNPFKTEVLLNDNFECPIDEWNSKRFFCDTNFISKNSFAFDNDINNDPYAPNSEDSILSDVFYNPFDSLIASDDSEIAMHSNESTNNNTDTCFQNKFGDSNCNPKVSQMPELLNEAMSFGWVEYLSNSLQTNVDASLNFNDSTVNTLNSPASPTKYTSERGIIQWVYKELCRENRFLEWEERTLLIFRIKPETKDQLAAAWFKTRKTKVKERDAKNNYDYFA